MRSFPTSAALAILLTVLTSTAVRAEDYYVSPGGADGDAGTSEAAAWRTLSRAIGALEPGDTLHLLDGEYAPGSTGLLSIRCGSNARNGTADAPITVRAANERRAFIRGSGTAHAVLISGCRHWVLEGLRASQRDVSAGSIHVVTVSGSRDVVVRRFLVTHSNRRGNNHVFAITNSDDILLEENEIYFHHRHAMMAWQSKGIVFRRNYIHERDHHTDASGDEAIAYYRGSYGIAENNISEGTNYGFHAHGGRTHDGDVGGSFNRFYGNISLNNYHASRIDARRDPYPSVQPARENYFENFVIVGTNRMGLWLSTASEFVAQNVTAYGAGTGFGADQRADCPCGAVSAWGGCSFELRNVLAFGNREDGIRSSNQDSWLVEHSNSFGNGGADYPGTEAVDDEAGNIRRSLSVEPTGMGLDEGECIVFVPEGSNMKGAGKDGADIGANILYRYVDGVLGDEPLWDPVTGAFPCGAIIEGVNDVPGASCFDVHERLHVNSGGCMLPYAPGSSDPPAEPDVPASPSPDGGAAPSADASAGSSPGDGAPPAPGVAPEREVMGGCAVAGSRTTPAPPVALLVLLPLAVLRARRR